MKSAAAPWALCCFMAFASSAWAGGEALGDLALEPHPGARLPLATELIDEGGNTVALGSFFRGTPVVLVLEYLRCRTICGVVLGKLADATASSPPAVGRDYAMLAISIDPRDSPADAAAEKAKYLDGAVVSGWHFLTGPETAVRPIADTAGFHYRYDKASEQYIHSTGIIVAAPDGTVGGYLADLDVTPAALIAALDNANNGRTAGPLGRFLLLCFGHGAVSRGYTPMIETALVLFNIAGMLAACGLFAWLRRSRHR